MPIEDGALPRANGDKSRQIRRDKMRQMPINRLLPFVAIGFYRDCEPFVPQLRKGMVLGVAYRRDSIYSCFTEAAAGAVCLMNLLAQAMKYFMFDRSSCPPSCWRQASSPSSSPVFTRGIFAVR